MSRQEIQKLRDELAKATLQRDESLFIWPTRIQAVDYFPAGGPYKVSDVLASQAMKDLLDTLGKTYTLILLVGPALSYTVDTEILAAYAHGIAVVLNELLRGLTPSVAQFVQSLREANAPLLGAVLCA